MRRLFLTKKNRLHRGPWADLLKRKKRRNLRATAESARERFSLGGGSPMDATDRAPARDAGTHAQRTPNETQYKYKFDRRFRWNLRLGSRRGHTRGGSHSIRSSSPLHEGGAGGQSSHTLQKPTNLRSTAIRHQLTCSNIRRTYTDWWEKGYGLMLQIHSVYRTSAWYSCTRYLRDETHS